MSVSVILVSHDPGLARHWQAALSDVPARLLGSFADLHQQAALAGSVIWLDADLPDLPRGNDARWASLLADARVVLASANPQRDAAVAWLEKGCAAYCHAFADADTLRQIQDVVASGNVWVGRELMQQLLATVQRAAAVRAPAQPDWARDLTEREQEVARLVAQGASNRDIANQCNITERTVKAHLAAAFTKLGITDRLQLALRVHGIQ